MHAGGSVVYQADPLLYGIGTIDAILPDGRITVEFEDGSKEAFQPMELEMLARFNARVAAEAEALRRAQMT